jgi:hypothetical protein
MEVAIDPSIHSIESYKIEWNNKGLEYPSELGDLKSPNQKAEYMTEAPFSAKFSLHSLSDPYMTPCSGTG